MQVRAARDPDEWVDAARLLFAYQRETAIELGKDPPEHPGEVWRPVRDEVVNPSSAFSTYLVAYRGTDALGGVALVAHDALSVLLKRCYVRPEHRRRGVAQALVSAAEEEAAQRGARRLVLDILASREAAITAWCRIGFVECDPWGDPAIGYFERPLVLTATSWLGLQRGSVALREHDARWSKVFDHHAEVLRGALADDAGGIEHVGSTAVPGLVAKPIVDVAVRLRPGAEERTVVMALQGRRYIFRGDMRGSGGLLFVAEDQPGRRIAHLHVLRDDDGQWDRYLRVRDVLRTDEDPREAYATLKRELAQQFHRDRAAYTAAKRAFIEGLLLPSRGDLREVVFAASSKSACHPVPAVGDRRGPGFGGAELGHPPCRRRSAGTSQAATSRRACQAGGGDGLEQLVPPHLAVWADLAARFVGAADRDDVVREALTRTWREARHTQVEVVNEPDVVLGRQRGLDGGCVKAPAAFLGGARGSCHAGAPTRTAAPAPR